MSDKGIRDSQGGAQVTGVVLKTWTDTHMKDFPRLPLPLPPSSPAGAEHSHFSLLRAGVLCHPTLGWHVYVSKRDKVFVCFFVFCSWQRGFISHFSSHPPAC